MCDPTTAAIYDVIATDVRDAQTAMVRAMADELDHPRGSDGAREARGRLRKAARKLVKARTRQLAYLNRLPVETAVELLRGEARP